MLIMNNIVVLMSTYNGSSFIKDQIESLLSQDYSDVKICIRDDGSTDKTISLLSEYITKKSIFSLKQGKNIGIFNSFFELLEDAGDKYQFYAFCDQDDVWKPKKISAAIAKLKKYPNKIPLLYCSRLEYVDENLNHIGFSAKPKSFSFYNSVTENCVTGCTTIINKSARELIIRKKPNFACMHDWWIYLIISAFGKIIYDDYSNILYRQHENNIVGGSNNKIKKNIKKIIPFLLTIRKNKKRTSDQVREFKNIYGQEINKEYSNYIDIFLSGKNNFYNRLRIIFSKNYSRQHCIDNILFKLQILFGLY